jgi:hypothetical protein
MGNPDFCFVIGSFSNKLQKISRKIREEYGPLLFYFMPTAFISIERGQMPHDHEVYVDSHAERGNKPVKCLTPTG